MVGGYYGLKALDYQEPITRTVDNIQKTLKDQKYTLLTSGNQHLSTVIQKYKAAINPNNNNLKLGNFAGDDVNGKLAAEILLEQCGLILKNEYTNSSDLEKAKRWCVEPITTSALLKKQNISLLNAENNVATDDTKWEKKIEKYNEDKNNPKIDQLDLSGFSQETKTQKINEIKSKCKEISSKNNYEDKFDENLKLLKLWCADN